MMSFMDAPVAPLVADLASRALGSVAKAMPPLWQYFSRLQKKAIELISAPKGVGPWRSRLFLLQIGTF